MRRLAVITLFIASLGTTNSRAGLDANSTVFIILMENHNWSSINGNTTDAPYINSLLPMASYCDQYYNPPGIHPSEPNYLWLEAGTNFGILNDNSVASNHQSTTNHFVTQLKNAGISWKPTATPRFSCWSGSRASVYRCPAKLHCSPPRHSPRRGISLLSE